MANSERTPEIVRHFIESDGVIRNGLALGLINARALARYIQVNSKDALSFEAIVSAIHRFPLKETSDKRLNVGKLIEKISMKNEMSSVAFWNRGELPFLLGKLSGGIDYGGGESLRIVSGLKAIRVVTDSKNQEKLTSKIHKNDIIAIYTNLAEVVVSFSGQIVKTPGVVAAIATELAINDVNLIECTGLDGLPNQIIVVVEEKDATKTYESLESLRRAAQRP